MSSIILSRYSTNVKPLLISSEYKQCFIFERNIFLLFCEIYLVIFKIITFLKWIHQSHLWVLMSLNFFGTKSFYQFGTSSKSTALVTQTLCSDNLNHRQVFRFFIYCWHIHNFHCIDRVYVMRSEIETNSTKCPQFKQFSTSNHYMWWLHWFLFTIKTIGWNTMWNSLSY